MIKIGKYTIRVVDELQFGLYETKKKGIFKGVQAEGTKEHLIGYYSYLDTAMSKILNLKALDSLEDTMLVEDILNGFKTVKTQLDDAYHHRSKDYKYIGEEI